MNTPAHLVFNLVALGKEKRRSDWWMISIGAFLPDLFLFLLFFIRGTSGDIFETAFRVLNLVVNSAPIFLLLFGASVFFRIRWLWFLSASILLHIIFDFFLHSEDAHRHFFPISYWVFHSPISFWDAEHFGQIVGTLEGVLFIVCFVFLWRWVSSRWGKGLVVILGIIYVATFIHFLGHAFAFGHWAIW